MTYTHNPSDPMVSLASTANNLVQQYESGAITLEQFKSFVNSQVTPSVATLNTSSHNDDAYHTISYAVSLAGAPE
jgi:hypothetical protein